MRWQFLSHAYRVEYLEMQIITKYKYSQLDSIDQGNKKQQTATLPTLCKCMTGVPVLERILKVFEIQCKLFQIPKQYNIMYLTTTKYKYLCI